MQNQLLKDICCISPDKKRTLFNVIIWFYFFASVAFGMAQSASPSTNAGPVLLVNGQPVSDEEFAWFMQQERAGVFQFVKTKFNLDYGTNFWDRDLAGGTPRALLKQRTVQRIVREKVQQLLFQKLGLVEDISYASIFKNLEKLNSERESAAQHGRVVYGPVRYTQLQYYEYWMADLRLRATEQLAQNERDVSDGQVRDFYERNKGKFRIGGTLTLEIVTLQTSNSETNGETIQAIARKIISTAKGGADLKTTIQEYDGNIKATWQRFNEMSDDRIGELFTDNEQAKKVLQLSSGQSLLLPVSKSAIQIVRCISKTPGHYLSFEEIKSRVKLIYIDQFYDQLVDEMVKKADVRINRKAMESLFQSLA
jgi:PPIC-type PPIASE domain